MDFVLDKHTPLAAHVQIQEQIKLALLLGRLRPGDTLPSTRENPHEKRARRAPHPHEERCAATGCASRLSGISLAAQISL